MRHILSDKNEELKTATCSVCGPVNMAWKYGTGGGWRCQVKFKQTNQQADRKRKAKKYFGEDVTKVREKYLSDQHGSCAICGTEIDIRSGRLDHCHETGETRGLLCNSCNLGLGFFKDNREALANAIEYLS